MKRNAVAMAADEPVAEGHTVIVPKEHAPSIHALPVATQKRPGPWCPA